MIAALVAVGLVAWLLQYRVAKSSAEIEEAGKGYQRIVVTEIPYMVQKARLIEKIAELLTDKKLPLLNDIRDESAEDIRIVLEPRAKTVDPEILMESLFKLTELEARIPMNMNVLVGGVTPRVLGLAEALREWLDHRRVVLQRRTNNRLGQIARRLEILKGLLVIYLDLDKVIKIIREKDEPKPALIKASSILRVHRHPLLPLFHEFDEPLHLGIERPLLLQRLHDLVAGLLQRLARARHDGDVHALPRKRECAGATEPAARAAQQRRLAAKSEVHGKPR